MSYILSAQQIAKNRQIDNKIADEYIAGATREELAEKYNVTTRSISRMVARVGRRLPPYELSRRRIASGAGRKPIWPDCPEHLSAEYKKLRAIIGSVKARQQLEVLDNKLNLR